MKKTLFLLAFCLLSYSLFSQKCMVGISVNPNMTLSRFGTPGDMNHNAAFSIGGGANYGVYLGKRFFLLTGLELTNVENLMKSNNIFNYSEKVIYRSWVIPLLGNFMLTNRNRKVSFFLTAGVVLARCTLIKTEETSAGSSNHNFTTIEKGKEILNPNYATLLAGGGCKINLNQKFSLLIIPNCKLYNWLRALEVSTVLMYNF